MIEKLVWLKGNTYSTLAQNKKFTILDVNPNAIIIRVHSTGRERRINRNELESAWRILVTKGIITSVEILNLPSRNSAFISSIFAQLGGVTYKTNPITLIYRDIN